jgi:hypothetical protein
MNALTGMQSRSPFAAGWLSYGYRVCVGAESLRSGQAIRRDARDAGKLLPPRPTPWRSHAAANAAAFRNGAQATLFSSKEPDRLGGSEHDLCDEFTRESIGRRLAVNQERAARYDWIDRSRTPLPSIRCR